MSKQLAISATFSVFAMACLVVFAAPGEMTFGENSTGAKAFARAPAVTQVRLDLPLFSN